MASNEELYDGYWDSWADMKIYGPASRWLRFLVKKSVANIELSSITTWLDVGCGEGTNTAHLADSIPTCQFQGIDFSSNAIGIAERINKRNNIQFSVDLDSDALANHYDVVSCLEVLEHVEDWESLLFRITQASNRYLLLSFPTGRMRPFEVNVGHLRNFKKGEVEDLLKSRNFHPINVQYAGFPFYSPFYRELCNLTDAGSSRFTQGKYGMWQKLVSNILYTFFRVSTRKKLGDQFVGLFEKK